jgi:hypothetical protein
MNGHWIGYVGSKDTSVRGKIMRSSEDLGNDVRMESLLLDLNSRNCFDFEYQSKERGELKINTTKDHLAYRYFMMIFKNGQW